MLLLLSDPAVVLTVLTAEFNVTEPSDGQNTTVTVCFSASLTQPRTMNHSFQFTFSSNSTARLNFDFSPIDTPFLNIPTSFNGTVYMACLNFLIIGDGVPEVSPEVVEYTIIPLELQDSVVYAQGRNSIVINIFDSDGGSCFQQDKIVCSIMKFS